MGNQSMHDASVSNLKGVNYLLQTFTICFYKKKKQRLHCLGKKALTLLRYKIMYIVNGFLNSHNN